MVGIIYFEETLNEFVDRLDVPCKKEKKKVMDDSKTSGLSSWKGELLFPEMGKT